jgi:hypothetical protein
MWRISPSLTLLWLVHNFAASAFSSRQLFSRSHSTISSIFQRESLSLASLANSIEDDAPDYMINRNRRSFATSVVTGLLGGMCLPGMTEAGAEDISLPKPIHTVFFDVRIARQDGSFFARDDLPDLPENKVFYGRLTLELFDATPTPYFMKYVVLNESPLDDNPQPSYSRSTFPKLDQATGLLTGGNIPGLEVTGLSGGTALRYRDRIMSAPLWLDTNSSSSSGKPSHSTKGLLTHRDLDVLPLFCITTRAAPELDSSHTVFGRVVPNDDFEGFLRRCNDLPIYSMERPKEPTTENVLVENVASGVFKAQRDIFRGAAKNLGDSRLDKLYDGKLLRRVEVTQVGVS